MERLQVMLTNEIRIEFTETEWTKFKYKKKYFEVINHGYCQFRCKKKDVLYVLRYTAPF